MERQKRERKSITVEIKKEIISKHENGKSISNLCVEYRMVKSTISTILKNKNKFKNIQVAKGISKLCKTRNNFVEEMESLLLVWIKENKIACYRIKESIICAKAKQLFNSLRENSHSGSDTTRDFLASKGWFARFRKRNGLLRDSKHGEVASADHKGDLIRKSKQHCPALEELVFQQTKAEYIRPCKINENQEQSKCERISNVQQCIRESPKTKEEIEGRMHFNRLKPTIRTQKVTEQERKRRELYRQKIALRHRFGIKIESSNKHCSETSNNEHKKIMPANEPLTDEFIPENSSTQSSNLEKQNETINGQQIYDSNQMNTSKRYLDLSQIKQQQYRNVDQVFQTCVNKTQLKGKKMFSITNHQPCVMSNITSLWRNRLFCDASLGNGSSVVLVHKLVLSAVCPKLLTVYDKNISSEKFLEINFPKEVSTEALTAFAEYMYNGLLDIDPDILLQLKIIANRLDMKEFEQLCDSHIPSTMLQVLSYDLTEIQNSRPADHSITVPTIQLSLPSSSVVSVTSQSAPSITTEVIDVKQEISEAKLAQVKKDTATVFGQESEVASLDASKSGNSSGGFVIVPSVKTEPVGPEDDRYGQLNNQSYTSTPVSVGSQTSGPSLSSTVVSTSEFVIPFSDTADSSNTSTNVFQGTSKLKSNVFESSLVSDLSPISSVIEKMYSASPPVREALSKPQNQTVTTLSTGSNNGFYTVGLFTADGNNLPLT